MELVAVCFCLLNTDDYAGGGPVHVASGFAGLAYCLILGKRKSFVKFQESKPHNLINVFVGTSLLWVGWFGFNGGSAIASSPRAALAAFVTVISASVGALFWAFLDFLVTKRWSMEKFCAGAVAGLVIITPASGFVAPWAALIMGLLGIVAVRSCISMKHHLGFDDTLDAFGIHGVGGVVGNLLTGIFADARIGAYDGTAINGGWISQNYIQLGYQVAGTVAIAAYSFIISAVLLLIIDRIPGLNLRATDFEEVCGLDHFQVGEEACLMSGETPRKNSEISENEKEPGLMIVTHSPSSNETIGA